MITIITSGDEYKDERVFCVFCDQPRFPLLVVPNYDQYQKFICQQCLGIAIKRCGGRSLLWFEREEKGWGDREIFTAWSLLRSRLLQIRLHRMCEPDIPHFYHGHPRHFLSIMLWGRYLEKLKNGSSKWRRVGGIAWRSRSALHYAWHPHGKASWSLVFFFGRKHPWEKANIR